MSSVEEVSFPEKRYKRYFSSKVSFVEKRGNVYKGKQ
jgi:hypothetical protein